MHPKLIDKKSISPCPMRLIVMDDCNKCNL